MKYDPNEVMNVDLAFKFHVLRLLVQAGYYFLQDNLYEWYKHLLAIYMLIVPRLTEEEIKACVERTEEIDKAFNHLIGDFDNHLKPKVKREIADLEIFINAVCEREGFWLKKGLKSDSFMEGYEFEEEGSKGQTD